MKKLSIFLCIVMFMAMLPTMGVYADYQDAADSISFVTFKGTNTDQFGVKSNLLFPERVQDADGNNFNVTWTSSNTNVISISEEASDGIYAGTVTRGVADEWVTVTAKVYHETAVNTFVSRNYLVRVLAADSNVKYLLQENFDDKEVSENASDITSTTVSSSDWYFNGNSEMAKRTDYKFVADDVLGGNALKMTGKSSVNNEFAVRKLTGSLPERGLVSYSVNIKMASANPTVIIRPFSRQMSISNITSFAISNAFSTSYPEAAIYNKWINLTTIYDVETKVAKVYVNGIFMFEENTTSAGSYLVWDEIRLRMVNGKNETVYVDNIEVKEILSGAPEKVKAFNPATKGSIYVDTNLASKVEGMAVSYESSDESVIAKDGSVTFGEFYKTVTVTPVVKAGNIELSGNAYTLTVLPKAECYKERLFEDFNGATEGKIFGDDGTATYNGWSLDSSRITLSGYSSYADAVAAGVKTEIKAVDGSKALLMEVPTGKKGYRLQKSVDTLGENDRVVLSMRIKNSIADTFALASSYIGMFNDYYDWRGDWGGNKVVDDITNDAFKKKNVWQTYIFVFDKTITENSAHPISLYIDGKYIGTQWENAASIGSYLSVLQLYQNNTNAYASSIYVDDILLAKIETPEIQFTGATVTNGVVKTIGVQYISYGTQKNMTAMLAAYNGDGLIEVKELWTDTDGIDTGYNEIPVDYTLPQGTTRYRLFLFDSLETLRPLAISKEYVV